MMYRVAGERLSNDPHSGSVSLSTFLLSDLNPLIRRLRFESRIDFTAAEFRECREFKDCTATCRRLRSEQAVFSSARPIYHQDELRLRSCLTMDTASKRDEAIIVLGLRSGFRVASLAAILTDIHIYDSSLDSLTVTIPSCKASRTVDFRVVLRGDDANVVRRWLNHRRGIFNSSPYLFITKSGTQITSDTITMMLKDLSRLAGYGSGFFSSHSFRVGFACRRAAEGFSKGESLQAILDDLSDGKKWRRGSSSVARYVDVNLRNFFNYEPRMTYREFCHLDISTLHSLETLRPTFTRVLDWFEHNETRLLTIARHGSINVDQTHSEIRMRIGAILYNTNALFREFLESVRTAVPSKTLKKLLSEVVGCLLEDEPVNVMRWVDPVQRDELFNCLVVTKNDGEYHYTTRFALRTAIHKLFNRNQAEQLLHNLSLKRTYDRKLHIGLLPDGTQVLLRARNMEINCIEGQLTPLQLDLHFPVRALPSIGATPGNLETNELVDNIVLPIAE